MALADQESITFYSGWNIDKLVTEGQATVTVPAYPAAAVEVIDLSSYGFTEAPKFIGLISFDSGTNWYLSGGGLFTVDPIMLTVTTTSLKAYAWDAGATVIIKYWIFSSAITE